MLGIGNHLLSDMFCIIHVKLSSTHIFEVYDV